MKATAFNLNGNTITSWPSGGTGDGHSLDAADGSPVDAVYVDNKGNVGIGTTSLNDTLTLNSLSDFGTSLFIANSGGPSWITLGSASNRGGFVVYHGEEFAFGLHDSWPESPSLIIRDSGISIESGQNPTRQHLFVQTETGNVGIGTTSPDAKFEVNNGAGPAAAGLFKLENSSLDIGGGWGQLVILNPDQTNGNHATLSFGDEYGPNTGIISSKITDHINNYGDLQFWTRGSDGGGIRLHIDDTGNVGIGTSVPAQKLEVNGAVKATSFIGDGSGITGISGSSKWSDIAGGIYYNSGKVGIGTDSFYSDRILAVNGKAEFGNSLDIMAGYGSVRGYQFVIGAGGGTDVASLAFGDGTGKKLHFGTNPGQAGTFSPLVTFADTGAVGIGVTSLSEAGLAMEGELKMLNGGNSRHYLAYGFANNSYLNIGGGNVGIGTTSPSYKLHVNGTAYAAGAAGALSDRRHKTNISDISFDAIEVVKELRPVSFEWKEPQDSGMEGTQFGFIAQEVEEVLPEAVLTQDNEEQTKGLKYNTLIPVLTKAIQELVAENAVLKARIEALEANVK